MLLAHTAWGAERRDAGRRRPCVPRPCFCFGAQVHAAATLKVALAPLPPGTVPDPAVMLDAIDKQMGERLRTLYGPEVLVNLALASDQVAGTGGTHFNAFSARHSTAAVIDLLISVAPFDVFGDLVKFMVPAEAVAMCAGQVGLHVKLAVVRDPIVVIQMRGLGIPSVEKFDTTSEELEADVADADGKVAWVFAAERRTTSGTYLSQAWTGDYRFGLAVKQDNWPKLQLSERLDLTVTEPDGQGGTMECPKSLSRANGDYVIFGDFCAGGACALVRSMAVGSSVVGLEYGAHSKLQFLAGRMLASADPGPWPNGLSRARRLRQDGGLPRSHVPLPSQGAGLAGGAGDAAGRGSSARQGLCHRHDAQLQG